MLLNAEHIMKIHGDGDGAVRALDDVSFNVATEEFVAIVGPSGSGKSTLLNILALLDRPTSGRVEIGGRDVAALSDDEISRLRNRDLGIVFQTYNLVGSLSALENVALPLVYGGIARKERWRRASEALFRVNLLNKQKRFPNELSGGEQQRVAIARALVTEPRVVLADEPTGALDTANGRGVLDLLAAIPSASRSVVIITHDRGVAARASRIVAIRDGRIDEAGADRLGEPPHARAPACASSPAMAMAPAENIAPTAGIGPCR